MEGNIETYNKITHLLIPSCNSSFHGDNIGESNMLIWTDMEEPGAESMRRYHRRIDADIAHHSWTALQGYALLASSLLDLLDLGLA